jgi:hypothetical protein
MFGHQIRPLGLILAPKIKNVSRRSLVTLKLADFAATVRDFSSDTEAQKTCRARKITPFPQT